MVRLAHVWSADLGLALSLHHIRHLIARGWEVYGICPPGPRVDEIKRAGVRWLPHTLERKMIAKGDPAALRDLYHTYRAHRFDIVHTHNAKIGIAARLVAAAARVPIIAHTHNGLIYSLDSPVAFKYGVAALERMASEVADCIFVQSQDDYDALVTTGGARPELLHLLGNGVDMTRFDPHRFDDAKRAELRRSLGVNSSDVLFFSAGRLVNEKGFVELFDAHREARKENPNVRLAIAGPADTERGLGIDQATLDKASADGVLLLGERSDMPELYAASDVVILPSWREGIARVLMEGAAMGKPLIASDARGCRNVVQPSWGLVTRLRSASAITNAILKLANSEAMRATIGTHNYAKARELYDLKRLVGQVDDVYDHLLSERGISDPSRPENNLNRRAQAVR